MKFLVNESSIYKKSIIKKNNLDYNVIFETSDNNKIHFTDLISLENFEKETLLNLIKSKKIFFLLIIWTENTFIAIADQVASYNILYEKKKDNTHIYLDRPKNFTINKNTAEEIYFSGYTINNHTLFQNIKSLLPGELLFITKDKFELQKWNDYQPSYLPFSKNDLDKKFNNCLEDEFITIKKNLNNKKILVPLSSGLDSRLIVSLAKNFDLEIETFTYGFQNKKDFRVAKEICEKLNLKNHQIIMNKKNSQIYKSNIFRKYLRFRDLGIKANNFGDFGPLYHLGKLIDLKEFKIMNGQSGDFISGNHLPSEIIDSKNKLEIKINDILEFSLQKHFSLWESNSQIKKRIKEKISTIYFNNIKNDIELASKYEIFEFENRQCKWVVGQQNVYDFFGIPWDLPLWKKSVMDFFSYNFSYEDKKKQRFYKDFLIKKNNLNIWKNIPINPKDTFSMSFSILRFFFKLPFIFFGKKKWYKFENKYLRYFMDGTGVFYLSDYKRYIKYKNKPRNSISLITDDYKEFYDQKLNK